MSRFDALARAWAPVEESTALDPAKLRRVRIVTVTTLVIGAVVLALSLRIPPGDPLFYWSTLALAAVWTIGGLVGERPRLGYKRGRDGRLQRPVLHGLLMGVALVALFVAGALVVARIPFLRGPVDDLLDHATEGSVLLVLALTMINGITEELFFRSTLYDALPGRWAIPGTVVIYAVVTAGSGVPLLVLAGVLLGIVTALQRRMTGGVLAPILTHITWSSAMLLLLPPLLERFG